MKKFLHIAIVSLLWISSFSISAESPIEQVNNIKRATDRYFFGQSTVVDKAQARLAAENILIVKIGEWLEANAPGQQFSPGLASQFKYIEVPKGKSTMILAYIERSAVSEYALGSAPATKPAAKPEPRPEPTPQPTPEPEPAPASEPEPSSSVPATETAISNASAPTVPSLSENQKAIIKELLSTKELTDVFTLLEKYQTRRKIKRYGDISSKRDLDDCFVIIGTRDFKVETILSPGPARYNYKTSAADEMSNYKGRPVVWFIFN